MSISLQSPIFPNANLLPIEMYKEIISYLDEPDLYRVQTVSRQIFSLVIPVYEEYCFKKIPQTLKDITDKPELALIEEKTFQRRWDWLTNQDLTFPLFVHLKKEPITTNYLEKLYSLDQEMQELHHYISVAGFPTQELANEAADRYNERSRQIMQPMTRIFRFILNELPVSDVTEKLNEVGKSILLVWEKPAQDSILNIFNYLVTNPTDQVSNSKIMQARESKYVLQVLNSYDSFIEEIKNSETYQELLQIEQVIKRIINESEEAQNREAVESFQRTLNRHHAIKNFFIPISE